MFWDRNANADRTRPTRKSRHRRHFTSTSTCSTCKVSIHLHVHHHSERSVDEQSQSTCDSGILSWSPPLHHAPHSISLLFQATNAIDTKRLAQRSCCRRGIPLRRFRAENRTGLAPRLLPALVLGNWPSMQRQRLHLSPGVLGLQ
jgi:hypothetical protein